MKTPKEVQTAWITLLKANTATIAPVSADEVRESQWKGTDFVYPNIRVRVVECAPNPNVACPTAALTIILVYSEEKSSNQADTIAGNIANFLHNKKFTASGVRFFMTSVERVMGAEAEGDVTWRSEIHIRSQMS